MNAGIGFLVLSLSAVLAAVVVRRLEIWGRGGGVMRREWSESLTVGFLFCWIVPTMGMFNWLMGLGNITAHITVMYLGIFSLVAFGVGLHQVLVGKPRSKAWWFVVGLAIVGYSVFVFLSHWELIIGITISIGFLIWGFPGVASGFVKTPIEDWPQPKNLGNIISAVLVSALVQYIGWEVYRSYDQLFWSYEADVVFKEEAPMQAFPDAPCKNTAEGESTCRLRVIHPEQGYQSFTDWHWFHYGEDQVFASVAHEVSPIKGTRQILPTRLGGFLFYLGFLGGNIFFLFKVIRKSRH